MTVHWKVEAPSELDNMGPTVGLHLASSDITCVVSEVAPMEDGDVEVTLRIVDY
jgi:hypothetical protein